MPGQIRNEEVAILSKIMSAMRKKSGLSLDLEFKLKTLDSVELFPKPSGPQMAEFERLANALISLYDGENGVAVTFASSVSGEGNSYVSFNVARHLSLMLDLRVAWIDANFVAPLKKPIECPVDFRSLLLDSQLVDNLRTAGQMAVIPNGSRSIKQTDILLSNRYSELLSRLAKEFAFTIIDAPPLTRSIDVAHLAKPTIGLVVVVETRRLKHEVVLHNIEDQRAQGVNVLGTVLNKRVFDIPQAIYRKIAGV
jgi:Mrp family chromosome partitioning ATPase